MLAVSIFKCLKVYSVPLCCGRNGVHYFYDAMQSTVSANGHVRPTEVVVNGAHHTNNIKVGGTLGLI